MTTTQTHAAQVLTDAETDQHLDAVLNGAGSALRHYTTEFSLSRMRAAMREHEAAILAKLQPAQGVPDATEEMLVAGLKECEPLGELIDWCEGFGRDEMRAVWQAMLTAAPTPPHADQKGQ